MHKILPLLLCTLLFAAQAEGTAPAAPEAAAPEFAEYRFEEARFKPEVIEAYKLLFLGMVKAAEPGPAAEDAINQLIEGFNRSTSKRVQGMAPLLNGVRQYYLNQMDLAEASFKACLATNPNEVIANLEMGIVHLSTRRPETADRHLKRFVDATTDMTPGELTGIMQALHGSAWVYRAGVARCLGDLAAVEAHLGKAAGFEAQLSAASRSAFAAMKLGERIRKDGPPDWTLGKGAWKQVGKHYVVMTDVSEEFAKKAVQSLESAWKLFAKDFACLGKAPEAPPFVVLVFRSEEGYQRFNERLRGTPCRGTVGYYDANSGLAVVWNDLSSGGQLAKTTRDIPRGLQTMFREACRQYLDRVAGQLPTWMVTGLGKMYENVEASGPSATLKRDQDYIEYIQDIAQGADLYGSGAFKSVEATVGIAEDESMYYPYLCIFQYFLRDTAPDVQKALLQAAQKGMRDNRRLLEVIYGKKGARTLDESWLNYAKKMHR